MKQPVGQRCAGKASSRWRINSGWEMRSLVGCRVLGGEAGHVEALGTDQRVLPSSPGDRELLGALKT